ncbi:hypothetical protein F4604DRAFT_1926402 [Suillus subluteus]|nr:hypothetical protein F4604DRAFT_1926402 [Suillus subluteus]
MSSISFSEFANLGAFAILIFDFCITFQDEVKWTWFRPWDTIRVIFTISRYLPFIGSGLTVYGESPTFVILICLVLLTTIVAALRVSGSSVTKHIVAAEGLLVIRTWAFWQKSKRVLIGLAAYSVVTIIAAVSMNVLPNHQLISADKSTLPGGGGFESSRNAALVYAILALFECVILALTTYKKFSDYRKVESSIITTIYGGSMFYMLCIIAITVTNVIIDAVFPLGYTDMFDTFTIHVTINVLPVEILSYIFTLATHDAVSTNNDYKRRYEVPFSPESVTMPTVLAAVHRHWRNIALSTSTLWSSLVMSLGQVVRVKVGPDADDERAYTTFLDVQRLAAHIARSRNSSVDILIDTRDPEWDFEDDDDTWAPLRVALERLSLPTLTKGSGAPRLESLMLMRCNEFLGHLDTFSPRTQHMFDGIPFAALTGAPHHDLSAQPHPLPKLRNLTLVGVHMNWTHFSRYTLGAALNKGCIQSLELSQHCREVRPTFDEFTGILKACPLLQKLTIRVSGPRFDAGFQRSNRPVSLPLLEEIHLGYTNVEDAAMLLSHIHAPNLIMLSIEDANHIASPDDEDSGASPDLSRNRYYSAMSKDSVARTIKTPFPHLERLSLHSVIACVIPFSLLIAAIPKLRHLSLCRTPNALAALLPIQTPFADACTRIIPCRALESIEIFCAEERTKHILDFVLREREQSGAPRVCNIDIHFEVCSADASEIGGYQAVEDVVVGNQITYGESVSDEEDPFAPGGVFNDPDFDEAYHFLS